MPSRPSHSRLTTYAGRQSFNLSRVGEICSHPKGRNVQCFQLRAATYEIHRVL